MRSSILAAVAALTLAVGMTPQEASARWVYKSSIRWDNAANSYVTRTEKVWVPDVVVVQVPVVVYPRPVIVSTPGSAPGILYPAPVITTAPVVTLR